MDPNLQQFVNVIGITSFSFLIALLAIWSLIWKGIALWKAARNGQKAWYIAMLVINTVGILEIIYILFFSKKNQTTNQ
jgi:methionyl-tRNA synthetase